MGDRIAKVRVAGSNPVFRSKKKYGLTRAAFGSDPTLEPLYAGCPTPVLPFQNGSTKEEIDLDAPGARFEDRVGGGG